MRKALLLPFLFLLTAASPAELAHWREQAGRGTITRDDWGIAHVRGKTDADAVFGMIYAQAEDDFPRIEANYLTALGRKAEAEGEKAIWQDLRARLYYSENELRAQYGLSPAWLRRLMDSWAAGLNHYLATHPQVKPRVLTRFEPWMALSFTEGSIGGDIERISVRELERFYSSSPRVRGEVAARRADGGGSEPCTTPPPPAFGPSPSPCGGEFASRHTRWTNLAAPSIPASDHSRSRSGGLSDSMNQRTASAPYLATIGSGSTVLRFDLDIFSTRPLVTVPAWLSASSGVSHRPSESR